MRFDLTIDVQAAIPALRQGKFCNVRSLVLLLNCKRVVVRTTRQRSPNHGEALFFRQLNNFVHQLFNANGGIADAGGFVIGRGGDQFFGIIHYDVMH